MAWLRPTQRGIISHERDPMRTSTLSLVLLLGLLLGGCADATYILDAPRVP